MSAARYLLLGVLLLAACVPRRSEVTVLRFAFWGSIKQQKFEEELIRAFEKEHPGIKVQPMTIGSRYPEKIQAMIVGNVAPDVLMVEMNQYAAWADRGVLVDLTDEVGAMTKDHPLMPVPAKAFARNGRYFAAPINCSGVVTYCNLDALKQAGIPYKAEGWTWEEIAEMAPKLSKRGGNPDAQTDYALAMPNPPYPILWAFGAKLFDDSHDPKKVVVNSPEAREAFTFMRRMYASKCVPPIDAIVDQGNTFPLFRDGRAAFFFTGRGMAPEFASAKFNWDVAPIPAGTARRVSIHGGSGLGVWTGSKQQEAARTFVRFYASVKGAKIAMKGGRYVPVYRDLAFGEEFLGLRPPASMQVFSQTMEEGASIYPLYAPGISEVARIYVNWVEEAVTKPDLSLDVILGGLEADLNRWLKRQQLRTAAP